jgi:hypothetical protein
VSSFNRWYCSLLACKKRPFQNQCRDSIATRHRIFPDTRKNLVCRKPGIIFSLGIILAGLSNRLDTSGKRKGLAGGSLLHARIRHDLYSPSVDDGDAAQELKRKVTDLPFLHLNDKNLLWTGWLLATQNYPKTRLEETLPTDPGVEEFF